MAKTMSKWSRLDNSAKIYPMLTNKQKQNQFRITYELYAQIDPDILQQALELTLTRFPSFKVKLMKGIFWYYFDANDMRPVVTPMSDVAFRKITPVNCNGYCFRLMYYRNLISAEFFHAICDGNGANEFMKSLIYTYLNLCGNEVYADRMIKTVGSTVDPAELEDSFLANYKKLKLSELKINQLAGKTAYRIDGILFDHGQGIVHLYCDSKKLLEKCHEKNCTMSELLCAFLLLSIYETQIKDNPKPQPEAQIMLPIDLRKIFPSITLRNFSLFSRVSANWYEDMELDRLIAIVHESLQRDLDKNSLSDKISTTVRGEKFLPMRLTPLVLKRLIFNISNLFIGKNKKTATFSNLGVIRLPEDMRKYVKNVNFAIATNPSVPLAVTASSTFGLLTITFVRSVQSTQIERRFTQYLTDLGLEVTVASNYWEVDHAL